MSLSQEPVFNKIRSQFVCGYRNISKEPYAGNSGVHPMNGGAVVTSNGAGPHNVQIFMLSEDGTVLHCLPGFWNADDLASELALAQKLNTVWLDRSISAEQKKVTFKKYQLEHLAAHSAETKSRSHLQGFDAQYIAQHAAQLPDLIAEPALLKDYKASKSGGGKPEEGMHVPDAAFKTTDEIAHERMSNAPFVAYSQFDVAAYTNYGTSFYDKNENEMEGKFANAGLKKLDLHSITHDASGASAPAITCQRAPSAAALTIEPAKVFADLISKHDFPDAFKLANAMVRSKPSQFDGYEKRAVAAYGLQLYAQAYSDATRAAWLGCKDVSNADLRKNAKLRCEFAAHHNLNLAQK